MSAMLVTASRFEP